MGAAEFGVVSRGEFQPSAKQDGPASRQGQTKTDAALGGFVRAATATEGLEDRARVATFDTGARIGHIQKHAVIFTGEAHEDGGALSSARMTTRIVHQDAGNPDDHVNIGP